jgi:4-hydroxybenzoate-CoA ligase
MKGRDLKLVDEAEREVADGEFGQLQARDGWAVVGDWSPDERVRGTFEGECTRIGDKYARQEGGYTDCGRSV